jgi:drug/metabolite transporter (DMT)-like permease
MAVNRNAAQTGILWMIVSAACLAGGNSLVRQIALDLHPFQISFLSNLLVLPFVWRYLKDGPAVTPVARTERRKLYAVMTVIGGISNLTWFYALAHVPLAKATAITFAAPIIVTVLAALVLGEHVSRGRWLALLMGFVGVLVISRPGVIPLDAGTTALFISTISMAIMFTLSKKLTGIESTKRIVAITTLIPIGTGLIPALLYWQTPSLDTIAFLLVMTGAMLAGRWTLLLAFRHAPASTVMPFDFARLPFITLFAYLAYREIPDIWAIAGAVIIMAAGFLVIQEEQRKQRASLA